MLMRLPVTSYRDLDKCLSFYSSLSCSGSRMGQGSALVEVGVWGNLG